MQFDRKENVFLNTLNIFEDLINVLNLPYRVNEKNNKFQNLAIPQIWCGCHPNEFVNFQLMGKNLGVVFSVHPLMLKAFKIKGNVTIGLLDYTSFLTKQMKDQVKYSPLPKFPNSTFDCTVTCSKTLIPPRPTPKVEPQLLRHPKRVV